MNLFLVFLIILAAFAIIAVAFWVLSSLVGDEVRSHMSSRPAQGSASFGSQYSRFMGHGGSSTGWEQIELQDMMDKQRDD